MTATDPAHRVRVTNPRTRGRPHRRRTVQQEIDEETAIGEVYMRSLMRSQLRLSIGVVVILFATIGCLPLVFAFFPVVNDIAIASIPLPWWLLGLAVYPVLFACGLVYVRVCERIERDFSDLVERP